MRSRLLPVMTGMLLALAVALAALAGALYAAGTDDEGMYRMFLRHAPVASTGLPEAEYRPVAEMTASFLAGQTDEFQHTFSMGSGLTYVCFNAREQAHMADCAALFELCRRVLWGALIVLLYMTALAYCLRRRIRTLLGAAICTFAVLLGCIGLLGVWAALDFDSLFILFHQMSFANDLWLLNPATDLLIRLMPTSFFIEYAARVGGVWLLICALCMAAAVIFRRKAPSDTNRGT